MLVASRVSHLEAISQIYRAALTLRRSQYLLCKLYVENVQDKIDGSIYQRKNIIGNIFRFDQSGNRGNNAENCKYEENYSPNDVRLGGIGGVSNLYSLNADIYLGRVQQSVDNTKHYFCNDQKLCWNIIISYFY